MRKILLFAAMLFAGTVFAQSTEYVFKSTMGFDVVDSLFSPYLCTVDSTGNLWVISTNLTSASAKNSLFKAAPGDATLKLVHTFEVSDSVRDLTGITSIGNDIYVSSRKAAPAGDPAPYFYPYSQVFYIPAGDVTKRVRFTKPSYNDYGTWYTCIDASKDNYLYYGQSYLLTIGTINANKTASKFGCTVDFARIDWGTAMEPGGDMTGPNAVDLIRDIAVDKNGNYSDTSTIIYTSRNSSKDPGGEAKGGIAKWTGGKSTAPVSYHSERITDISGFLTLKELVPYGITLNPATGNLFVCGTDSDKKWVKGFKIVGSFAIQDEELPSSTSNDIKDAKGAPFNAPGDVAFNKNGTIVYVTDEGAKKVFKFEVKTTGVNDKNNTSVKSFELLQNYPNPFNPSTNVVFSLAAAANVKAVVYDMFGRQVTEIAKGNYASGTHVIKFDGAKYASGVYVCKVQSGSNVKSIKMVLTK